MAAQRRTSKVSLWWYSNQKTQRVSVFSSVELGTSKPPDYDNGFSQIADVYCWRAGTAFNILASSL